VGVFLGGGGGGGGGWGGGGGVVVLGGVFFLGGGGWAVKGGFGGVSVFFWGVLGGGYFPRWKGFFSGNTFESQAKAKNRTGEHGVSLQERGGRALIFSRGSLHIPKKKNWGGGKRGKGLEKAMRVKKRP